VGPRGSLEQQLDASRGRVGDWLPIRRGRMLDASSDEGWRRCESQHPCGCFVARQLGGWAPKSRLCSGRLRAVTEPPAPILCAFFQHSTDAVGEALLYRPDACEVTAGLRQGVDS